MRVILHAPLSSSTGYGRDGLGLLKALVQAGHDVDVVPSQVVTPIPPEAAQLLTYPPDGKYDLEIHHVPPGGALDHKVAYYPPRKRVLWTMWEWDNVPQSFPGFQKALERIPTYDQVVCYTQQTADAFRQANFLTPESTVSVVQGGFDPEGWIPPSDPLAESHGGPQRDRSRSRDTFRFGMVGVMGVRKNPYTVIRAYSELKDELGDEFDAQLIIKTEYPMLPSAYTTPGVSILNSPGMTDIQLRNFYWTLDTLINVSWGEGKDLPALEATMCGVPTILNDTPGHQGWMHPGIQELIPAYPVPMNSEYTGRFTGVPEVKKAMLEAYRGRAAGFRRSQQLAAYVGKRVSWDHRIKKFGEAVGVPL